MLSPSSRGWPFWWQIFDPRFVGLATVVASSGQEKKTESQFWLRHLDVGFWRPNVLLYIFYRLYRIDLYSWNKLSTWLEPHSFPPDLYWSIPWKITNPFADYPIVSTKTEHGCSQAMWCRGSPTMIAAYLTRLGSIVGDFLGWKGFEHVLVKCVQVVPICGEQMGETKKRKNCSIITLIPWVYIYWHILALTIVGTTHVVEKPVFIDGHQHGLLSNRHSQQGLGSGLGVLLLLATLKLWLPAMGMDSCLYHLSFEKKKKLNLVLQRLHALGAPKAW